MIGEASANATRPMPAVRMQNAHMGHGSTVV